MSKNTPLSHRKASLLAGLKKQQSLTSLAHSNEIQKACATRGFDWPTVAPVFDKVDEELAEVKEAIDNPNKTQKDVQEELGDLLFACVNLCRHLQIDPDAALQSANQKFIKRFEALEHLAESANTPIIECDLEQLEAFWHQVKNNQA